MREGERGQQMIHSECILNIFSKLGAHFDTENKYRKHAFQRSNLLIAFFICEENSLEPT